MKPDETPESDTPQSSASARLLVWARRAVRGALLLLLVYAALLLIGLIPVNGDFVPTPGGIEVLVVSNGFHAELILPSRSSGADWVEEFRETKFRRDVSSYSHVAFGWGDLNFFVETEKREDLNLATAAGAVFLPTESCLHVSFTEPRRYRDAVRVQLAEHQYAALVAFVRRSIARNASGHPSQVEGAAYHASDAFIRSHGRYHCFATCNSWVGRGLELAGVKVPWFCPMPRTPTLYLR